MQGKSSGNTSSNSNTNSNNFKFDMDHLNSQKAIDDHKQNIYNNQTQPSNGTFDRFEEARLRTAIIENYTIKNNNNEDVEVDPLNIDHVVNMKNGQVVIRWINYSGGIIRPENYGYPEEGYPEPWSYFPEKDSKYPENRTLDCYNHDKASDKEMIPLSHAFIWANDKNWCGINYLPPVGAIVIVGFKKGNLPMIIGYLTNNYNKNTPYLKPGETLIKGYGNNYIHWRWSDKLDMHVQSKKGNIDVDDPYKKDEYPNSIEMWMRFDPYTRNILISVDQTDEDCPRRTIVEIKPETVDISCEDRKLDKKSIVNISTEDIYLLSTNSNEKTEIYIDPTNFKLNTDGEINIKAKGDINIDGLNVNINSN